MTVCLFEYKSIITILPLTFVVVVVLKTKFASVVFVMGSLKLLKKNLKNISGT